MEVRNAREVDPNDKNSYKGPYYTYHLFGVGGNVVSRLEDRQGRHVLSSHNYASIEAVCDILNGEIDTGTGKRKPIELPSY